MQGNRHIKNILADFEAEPSPAVWKKINGRLQQDDKRKRGIWMLFILLLSSGGIAWLLAGDILNLQKDSSANNSIPVEHSLSVSKSSENTPKEMSSAIPKANSAVLSDLTQISFVSASEKSHSATAAVDESQIEKALKLPSVYSQSSVTPAISENTYASLNFIIPIRVGFSENPNTIPVLTRNNEAVKPHHLSRWQIGLYFGIGKSFRHFKQEDDVAGEEINLDQNERGVQSLEAGIRLTYDINPHLAIRTGAGYFTSGLERTYTRIVVSGPLENQQYSLASSLGEVEGNASELNQIFFNDPTVPLIMPNLGAGAGTTDDKVFKQLSLKEKFEFISVPVTLVYKLMENRITPYVSIGASINYLTSSTFFVNDERIHYSFVEKPNLWSVSALASAGLSFRASSRFTIQAEPTFRYSMTSLSSNNKKVWKPYSFFGILGMSYRF